MSNWMNVTVQLPEDDGLALLMILREKMGFTDVDWCEMQRADRSLVMYGPCAERTDSGLTVDPFPPTT